MKNALKYWFCLLIILLFSSVFLISCKSKKPIVTEQISTKIDSVKENKTTINKTVVNASIKDSSAIKLPNLYTGQGKKQDSICNARYREALQTINFYKKSGANQYKIFYNKENQMIYTIAEMQELINEKDSTIYTLEKTKIDSNNTTQTVTIKVYPKWLVWLAILGVLFIIFLGYRFSKIFA
jgi:L-rhamnose mutarotase